MQAQKSSGKLIRTRVRAGVQAGVHALTICLDTKFVFGLRGVTVHPYSPNIIAFIEDHKVVTLLAISPRQQSGWHGQENRLVADLQRSGLRAHLSNAFASGDKTCSSSSDNGLRVAVVISHSEDLAQGWRLIVRAAYHILCNAKLDCWVDFQYHSKASCSRIWRSGLPS